MFTLLLQVSSDDKLPSTQPIFLDFSPSQQDGANGVISDVAKDSICKECGNKTEFNIFEVNALQCCYCKDVFHGACIGVDKSLLPFLYVVKEVGGWGCPTCRFSVPTDRESKGKQPSPNAVKKSIDAVTREVIEMKSNLQAVTQMLTAAHPYARINPHNLVPTITSRANIVNGLKSSNSTSDAPGSSTSSVSLFGQDGCMAPDPSIINHQGMLYTLKLCNRALIKVPLYTRPRHNLMTIFDPLSSRPSIRNSILNQNAQTT